MNKNTLSKIHFDQLLILIPRSSKFSMLSEMITEYFEKDGIRYTIVTQYELKKPRSKILKYRQIDEINKETHLIFDNIERYYDLIPMLDYSGKKIIIFSSWGDSIQIVNEIAKVHNKMIVLTFNPNIKSKDIVFDILTAKNMSNDHYHIYQNVRKYELAKYEDAEANFPLTRMITNYKYPIEIVDNSFDKLHTCEAGDNNITRDYQWINQSQYERLIYDSPKLFRILSYLNKSHGEKIIIFSRFNYRYGVDLIYSMISLAIKNKILSYDQEQVYFMSCTQNHDENLDILEEFKLSSKGGILISNIIPVSQSISVDHVIVLDSYNYESVKNIIRSVRPRIDHVNFNLVVQEPPKIHKNEIFSDKILSGSLLNELSEYDQFFYSLNDYAAKLVYDIRDELVIQKPIVSLEGSNSLIANGIDFDRAFNKEKRERVLSVEKEPEVCLKCNI